MRNGRNLRCILKKMFANLDGDQLEAVARVVTNACLPRDIDPKSGGPDREAVTWSLDIFRPSGFGAEGAISK